MIDVTKLGARGNGTADDTAAIQKALNQAAQSGDTVYFPAGVYRVNPAKTLSVGGRTQIKGSGRASIIRAADVGFGWELIRVNGSDVSLNDIVLDGGRRVNRVLTLGSGIARVSVNGLVVQGASHSTDSKSAYYGGVVSGIIVLGDSEAINIVNTEVHDIVAQNLSPAGLVARGIYLTTTWASRELAPRRVTISNCYIHHIGPANDGDGLYYEDPAMEENRAVKLDSVIADNRFDYCAKRAIKVFARGLVVRGNTINNPYLNNNYYSGAQRGQQAPDMYSAISIYGGDSIVEGNRITGSGSFYAAIEVGAGATLDHITIQDNTIAMGPKSTTKGTTAIRLGSIHDFQIAGNTIQGGERGVWTWQSAEDGRIERNVIRVPKGVGIDLTTYLRGHVQRDILCKDNDIKTAASKIKTSSSTNVNVKLQ